MNKLVVIDQKLIDWVTKGEVKKNYFNPDKLYKEITILALVRSKKPSKSILKKLCGTRSFRYIEFNSKFLVNNFFKYLIPFYLYKLLILKELKSLSICKPKIIFCIGDGYSGYISGVISEIFNCRLVLSLHSFTNSTIFLKYFSFKEKVIYLMNLRFKRKSHKYAHQINIVYKKIEENVSDEFKKKIRLVYNRISLKKKNLYEANINLSKINLIFVGRLIKGKSLLNIIKAIHNLENVTLTVFGDGPERLKLQKQIDIYKLHKKVFLKGFVNNEIILNKIQRYHAFIAFHKFYEFPKTIMEALSNGIPVILNSQPSKNLYEFKKFKIIWTSDKVESYRQEIINLKKRKYNLKLIKKNNENKIKNLLNMNDD